MQMPLLHIITYMNIDIAFKKNIDIHEQKNICKTLSFHFWLGFITIQTIISFSFMFLTFSYLKYNNWYEYLTCVSFLILVTNIPLKQTYSSTFAIYLWINLEFFSFQHLAHSPRWELLSVRCSAVKWRSC